jgi:hypothetical protein
LPGASIPENLGGLGKDFITSTLVNEGPWRFSFPVALAAPTGDRYIADLYFVRSLKKIYSETGYRRMERSYGLTELNSGSDAPDATTAT